VGVIPRGVELFAFDATFYGFLAFQQIQREPSQGRQVLRCVMQPGGWIPRLRPRPTRLRHRVHNAPGRRRIAIRSAQTARRTNYSARIYSLRS